MGDEEKSVTFLELLREYWHAYGGARELAMSPYLYFAIALTPLTFGEWSRANWWDTVIGVVPVLLGISLAAFTLFLAAGSEGFREVIAGQDAEETSKNGELKPSPFVRTAAVFLHFLIVQFLALVFALIAKSMYKIGPPDWFSPWNGLFRVIFWACSYFVFMYALTVVLAASFAVYEVVKWFDDYVTAKRDTHCAEMSRCQKQNEVPCKGSDAERRKGAGDGS